MVTQRATAKRGLDAPATPDGCAQTQLTGDSPNIPARRVKSTAYALNSMLVYIASHSKL